MKSETEEVWSRNGGLCCWGVEQSGTGVIWRGAQTVMVVSSGSVCQMFGNCSPMPLTVDGSEVVNRKKE